MFLHANSSVRKITRRIMNEFCWNVAQSFGTRKVRKSLLDIRILWIPRLVSLFSSISYPLCCGSNILLIFVRWQHSFRDSQLCCSDTQCDWKKVGILVKSYSLRVLLHCVPKNVPLCDCLYLRQVLTNFQNSFTDAFCRQLAINWLLNIPPPFNRVATLPCEI